MARYQFWNHQDTIYTPSGNSFTAEEWENMYSWCKIPGIKMIITTGPINGGVCFEYEQTKAQYKQMGANITDEMTPEQVLQAIEDYEDNPPVVDAEPDSNERIAAALEAQVMMAEPESASVMSLSLDTDATENNSDIQLVSAAYERIRRNYQKGLWSSSLVALAVEKGNITAEEADKIINGLE